MSTVLPGCSTKTWAWDSKLRLTDYARNQMGGVFLTQTVRGDELLVSNFNSYQYGAADTPADGLAFAVAAADPADPRPPARLGSPGGGLGYSSSRGASGLPNGYLGFGLDVYGGFSRTGNQGSGCPAAPYVSATTPVPGQVVVRGPGNKGVGYCALASTATSATSAPVPLHARSFAASKVPVEVAINPTGRSITTEEGTTVAGRSYAVTVTPVGEDRRTLRGPLPKVAPGLYPAGWVDADGYPKRFAYGVVGTTGGSRDNHQISDMRAYREHRPAKLSVTPTAYLAEAPTVGDPVSYLVRVETGLSGSGDLEFAKVRSLVTLPDGVRPLGGSGTGWNCVPLGQQQLDCRQDDDYATPYTALGTKLVIQGQATRSGLTRAAVAAGTRVETSAAGAKTVVTETAATAQPPAGPENISLDPVSGPTGTSVSVTGDRLNQVSMIRVGTADELASGTAAAPRFGIGPGYRDLFLNVEDHPVGPVQVQLMGLGRTTSASFTYDENPERPRVSAWFWQKVMRLEWRAGADGGSPVTSWTVTPYRDGVRQTRIEVDGKAKEIVVPNVRAGEKYVFTVVGHNANGSSLAGTSDEVKVY